jgi:hypothetical protein
MEKYFLFREMPLINNILEQGLEKTPNLAPGVFNFGINEIWFKCKQSSCSKYSDTALLCL